MTEAEVQSALNAWLASVTGVATVINAHPDAPRPAKPYCMTNLTISGAVYLDPIEDEFTVEGEGEEDETITQAPVRDWYWRFSVFAYGDAPMSTLRKIDTAWKVPTAHGELYPLTIFEASAVRNVPELVENAWEKRANMDIEVRGIVRDGLVVDVIEEVPVTVQRA
ncbi:hypothetical protein L0F51_00245 [Afifella sp. H1R]|uniref:phage neck terminator protein n=1 Tax=Afifella sp. H1R TaxID=2908841 RepID=UPI001F37FBBF|nr:hypothetical protein [Afifella sp. H1R]MCF1502194.1 hypothetical protein [Afifella sp. H1R]